MKASDLQVTRFKGLNTVDDPLTLGLGWFTQADNILITADGKVGRRDGFTETPTLAGTSITAAYATRDQERAYLIDDGTLKTADGVTLTTGLASDLAHWCEANDLVFMANGTDALMIDADNEVLTLAWPVPPSPAIAAVTGGLAPGLYMVCCTYILPDGRETGPSDVVEIVLAEDQALQVSAIPHVDGYRTRVYICAANSTVFALAHDGRTTMSALFWNSPATSLGVELRTQACDPIPEGCDVIQHWQGRLWAALYHHTSNTTAIFPSKALGFHLFDLDQAVAVTGRVLMMAPTDAGLVIGTDRHIWVHSADGQLTLLARYGVIPGMPWAFDVLEDGRDSDKTVLFWSQRGLCRALPFANLTAGHLSVAPGVRASAAVLARGGEKHFIANLHAGGSAFNPWQ